MTIRGRHMQRGIPVIQTGINPGSVTEQKVHKVHVTMTGNEQSNNQQALRQSATFWSDYLEAFTRQLHPSKDNACGRPPFFINSLAIFSLSY
jgi:hypothetical protein